MAGYYLPIYSLHMQSIFMSFRIFTTLVVISSASSIKKSTRPTVIANAINSVTLPLCASVTPPLFASSLGPFFLAADSKQSGKTLRHTIGLSLDLFRQQYNKNQHKTLTILIVLEFYKPAKETQLSRNCLLFIYMYRYCRIRIKWQGSW